MKILLLSGRKRSLIRELIFWCLCFFPANQITSSRRQSSAVTFLLASNFGGANGRGLGLNQVSQSSSLHLCVNNLCVSLQSDYSSMRQKAAASASKDAQYFQTFTSGFKVQTIRSATWALTRVKAVSTLVQRGENLRSLVGFPPALLMKPA